jgi:hypothetical protein
VLALTALDSTIGAFAGATLVAAGVIVWLMRRRYRRQKMNRATSRSGGGSIRMTGMRSGMGRSYYNNYD